MKICSFSLKTLNFKIASYLVIHTNTIDEINVASRRVFDFLKEPKKESLICSLVSFGGQNPEVGKAHKGSRGEKCSVHLPTFYPFFIAFHGTFSSVNFPLFPRQICGPHSGSEQVVWYFEFCISCLPVLGIPGWINVFFSLSLNFLQGSCLRGRIMARVREESSLCVSYSCFSFYLEAWCKWSKAYNRPPIFGYEYDTDHAWLSHCDDNLSIYRTSWRIWVKTKLSLRPICAFKDSPLK